MFDSPPITFLVRFSRTGRRIWHVVEHMDYGSIGVHQLENLSVHGDCFSHYGPWLGDESRSQHWQFASDGRLSITGVSGTIRRAETDEETRRVGDCAEIRVALCAKQSDNVDALPWEILILHKDKQFERYSAGTFHIRGICRTAMEVVDGGPKWYIGCRGSFRLDGKHAVIATNP